MGADDQQQKQEKTDGQDAPKKESSAFVKKAIKVVTVIAYASGISSAGVLLSLYYIFFWDPRITGVKPPGYLQSGEWMGPPEARVAADPMALKGEGPIAQPHKMSREIMEALTLKQTEDEVLSSSDMRERQPTPRVLPLVKESFEVAAPAAHLTATHPNPGDDPATLQDEVSDSSVNQPSKQYPLMSFSKSQQHQQRQDQHEQQQQQQLEPLRA